MRKHLGLLLFLFLHGMPAAYADEPFHFENIRSLNDMKSFIEEHFALGAARDGLRKTFVNEGGATRRSHPSQAGVEKYLYDINLCSYYIWRWNISADYDASGHLLQAYVNGDPVFASGTPRKDPNTITHAADGKKASIYKAKRARPEASKGEKYLVFTLIDGDSDLTTIDDQLAIGPGPSRPDPLNMGKTVVYQNVEPWRSIFDSDKADSIVPYSDDCIDADIRAEQKHYDMPIRMPLR